MKNIKKINLLFTLSFISNLLFATGNQVPLQGVRQAALGGIGVLADDASVGFYNPAGLANIKDKVSISAGVFGVSDKLEFTSKADGKVTKTSSGDFSNLNTPFYVALNFKPSEAVAIGVNVNKPFSEKTSWETDNSQFSKTNSNLNLTSLQPSVAFKLKKWISFGVGAIYYSGNMSLNSNTSINSATYTEIKTTSNNKISEWGWNAGVYLKPADGLSMSLAYKSSVGLTVEDASFFSNVNSLNTITSVDTTIPLPAQYTFGIGYKLDSKLMVLSEFNLVKWSEFKSIGFLSNNGLAVPSQNKNWNDGVTYRMGIEYSATDKVKLRLGYSNEKSVSSININNKDIANLNDLQNLNERNYLTGGLGLIATKNIAINLFGSYLVPSTKTLNAENNLEGKLQLNSLAAGVGIIYSVK